MSKSLLFVTILLSAWITGSGQTKTVETGVLIKSYKPAVYLEFVKTGVCHNGNYVAVIDADPCEKKSELDQTFNAVWVRVVNNTRWSILLDVQKPTRRSMSYPIELPSKATVTAAKDGAELDLIYDIETETGCDFGVEAPKGKPCARRETTVPDFNRRGMTSSEFVSSGQSIIYAINQDHLKKYLTTYVYFNFDWEVASAGMPPPRFDVQHRLYFGWYDLELGLKKESESKTK